MVGSLPSSGPALSQGCGLGDWASPWVSGRERAVPEAGGRQARAVSAHLGSAWCWLELSSGRCLGSAARAQLGGCEAEP